jgi:hypothetical protein
MDNAQNCDSCDTKPSCSVKDEEIEGFPERISVYFCLRSYTCVLCLLFVAYCTTKSVTQTLGN